MPHTAPTDLRALVSQLARRGELVNVDVEVDPCLEVAEIHRRVIAAGGPALLFERVLGSDLRVVTNLFGTADRALAAFGGEGPLALVRRLAALPETLLPATAGRLWRARDLALKALRVGLYTRRRGPVNQVLECPPQLDRLPVLTTWEEDGGPFLTLPLVYTEHPDGRGHNLGMYRLQIHDSRTTGMHWQIGKGGGFHYAAAESLGRALPVTAFLGGPPAMIMAAIAPLPENVPELLLASLLLGRRIPMVRGAGPHPIPANAEIALIGRVPPRLRRPEGPFGDHYGYYSLRHDYPVFEVDRVIRRRDAILPATVVGKPRQEDFFIGDLLQDLLSPLFPLVMPGVEDLWSYGETGYHSLASARVKERYGREAMASAFRILGEGQLSLTKFLLVVDRPVDLKNFPEVLEHLLARTRPESDLYVFSHLAMDTLDYTGPRINEGSKGVWLGLGEPRRDLPREFRPPCAPPADLSGIRVFCGGCLVLGALPFDRDPTAPKRLAEHPAFAGWPLLVLTDEPSRAAASPVNFLWTTFTRFEPAADLHAAAVAVRRHHLSLSAPIVLDARLKPGFPAELRCDAQTAARVDRRWKEYFPNGGVEMGDSEAGHLDPPLS